MGLRGMIVTRRPLPLPILVGGGDRQEPVFCGSAGAGSLAAGAAMEVCPAVKGCRRTGSGQRIAGFLLRADQIQHLQGDAVGPANRPQRIFPPPPPVPVELTSYFSTSFCLLSSGYAALVRKRQVTSMAIFC